MSGDRTFQTGGVQYDSDITGLSNGTVVNFGSGTTVAYAAASDTYTLTAPGGTPTASFGPLNALPPNPNQPNTQQWRVMNGSTGDNLTLIVPTTSSGVPLSYTIIGIWNHLAPSGITTNRLSIGGSPTVATDMPKTGTANYSLAIGGAARAGSTSYNLGGGNSTGTYSANFGTGQITTVLNLAGVPNGGTGVTSFGTFNGTGSVTAAGPGFTGTLAGTTANGIFSGAFFGPQALEMGYAYFLSGTNFSAVGTGVGIKQ